MITIGFALGQSGVWTAGQFSEIMRLAAGDGVCLWGGAFAPELSGMTVTLATGFALVGGRWLKSDSPVSLSFPPPSIHADRVDAVAVCVEEGSKRVVLRVLAGVDLSGLHEGVMDTADGPALVLYTSLIRRGAQSAGELADHRRMLPTLEETTAQVLRAYDFAVSGVDQEVERLLALAQAAVDKASAAVEELDKTLQAAGRAPAVGDLATARVRPGDHWLLCSGGPAPPQYPALALLTGPLLPDVTPPDPRLGTWIFAGEPAGEEGAA